MEKHRIVVIGAANVDISAQALEAFRMHDSNPSIVSIGFGGVGRNIAHNLCLLGADVRFISLFSEDALSKSLYEDCKKLGMVVEPALVYDNEDSPRGNYFVCINDEKGEMQAGAADTGLLDFLDPSSLHSLEYQNDGAAIVVDCNLRKDTLREIADTHSGTLYIDATSGAKAAKVRNMLLLRSNHTADVIVKANLLEAQRIVRMDADAPTLAEHIIALGAKRVYITLGAEGVFCHDGSQGKRFPSDVSQIVNTTGAGDAFMAGVVMGEMSGLPAFEATRWGMRAASLALQCCETVNPEMNMAFLRGENLK